MIKALILSTGPGVVEEAECLVRERRVGAVRTAKRIDGYGG